MTALWVLLGLSGENDRLPAATGTAYPEPPAYMRGLFK